MFRYLFHIFAVALLLCQYSAAETPKMATVDMQKLFKNYHRTISAQAVFNKEYARIQKGVNERLEVANAKRQMLTANSAELKKEGLSDDERLTKQREQQMMIQELRMIERASQNYSQRERAKIAQQKAASMHGIMNEIKQKVEAHAKANGYDYVFDKSGKNTNQITFFIYLKDAADITASMLKELNKFAPESSGK
ncbi:MAG: OmpH family outer membrane protein [Akkermansiaceae bacterium]